ncbi:MULTISPECIES: anhydro-N-acetylmuramic acid kinase [unclassified Kaistella]|uniref:anhydro-N-acetylmuramic acid kinase n=1 Tax=unclassified Kaistella TaxID=2762626 RepID=UPI0027377353|nr:MULTISPECIES: anhydro-N-acetylmuramic acid kinase [unclassified Kaistella]MDP2454003.1 anhydro-N-acetylmuramic acid kinase [Kaistella sp. SH11-4b]MDP2457060.1 anhydro-N-acetylmuramic acid kinase [Kaistella sp. SH40-3]MDP2459817.1 anhydro-N-acetylmuramic acid kinase [Kaistella sp. SH19-2b]
MNFHALGLMSGTSLDGLDICHAFFEKNEVGKWNFKILHASTFPYSETWENKLRNAIHLSAEELFELNSEYGFYLGQKAQEFIEKYSLENITFIASHGHTVFHQPQKKFTVQIGDGRAIKLLTHIPVIYDFRSQDVLMGGNGAPLVPIGDELLFSEFDACLNIGGFSNISFKENGKRIAFDICPVNIVLNHFAKQLGKEYDENGDFARNGIINDTILSALNSIEYYHQNPPKSLGMEWVSKHILPEFKNENPATIIATFTEHAAIQIADIFNHYQIKKVLFTGGGTYNSYLVERIKSKTQTEIIIPEKELIDFKEALIFAFMGVLRMKNENNVMSSATGSSDNHCSGILV